MAWTSEQQKVIDLRNRNILVSAAAGSGKTAVLVERIIQRITDKEHPVDIDELLVVTFTNAAAAEMRERIGKAINKALKERPDDENLMKQVALVHNAKITTIDSFCNFIVRNHFGEIQLDPNFRIADQGEIKLLKQDTIEAVFEAEFEAEKPSFLQLVDAYGKSRSSANVKDMVLAIVEKSESASWPMEWLDGLTKIYGLSEEELEKSPLFEKLVDSFQIRIADALATIPGALAYAKSHEGAEKFAKTLESDLALLQELSQYKTYRGLAQALSGVKFASAGAISSDVKYADTKNYLTNQRKSYKDGLERMIKEDFSLALSDIAAQNARLLPYIEELVRLAKEVLWRLDESKKKKHMVDFCDIEHYALRILREETGSHAPKKTAIAFRQHFAEIMIDEYQDSNQVQEDILTAISRMEDGEYNMFMVGDVKQSIYRFRQAKPELFMEKHAAYSLDEKQEDGLETKEQKIELRANFRSRPAVLEMANDICYKIMAADLGGVAYTEEVALHPASTKYDAGAPNLEGEVLMFDSSDPAIADLQGDEAGKRALEARMVATKIKELKENFFVTEEKKIQKEDGTEETIFGLRPMRYGDVVILLRSNKGWGDVFADTLNACGIPAHVESSTGYFSASEVVTVLDLLRILDNPYQDIPMAAVLKSQLVGLDNEELAEIAAREEKTSFSRKAVHAMEEASEGALFDFYQLYMSLRARRDLPIHELLQLIFDCTGYDKYVAALPAGERRLANLDMLMEKAVAFEQTSYKGLFHFVRYIEQLHKYDVDYGEAETAGDASDTVRIMTIHKSKGLEFPVVFVSGLGKGFNHGDERGDVVIHADFGLGIDEQSVAPRTKKESFLRDLIENQCKEDMLGEEVRMLYVALTRASEKMILTGAMKGEEEYEKKVGNALLHQPISYDARVKAGSYNDWILPAIASYRGEVDKYPLQLYGVADLIEKEAKDQAEAVLDYDAIRRELQAVSPEQVAEVEAAFAYAYPYENKAGMKIKYAVSDLKHLAMDAYREDQEAAKLRDLQADSEKLDTAEAAVVPKKDTEELWAEDHSAYIPRFAREDMPQEAGAQILAEAKEAGINPGALRGTATHRIMECIDFAALLQVDQRDLEAVQAFRKEQVEQMLANGRLSKEENRLVKREWIDTFLMSDVARRMAEAASRGELYKEQPFVMRYTGEKYANVLIQGIIDVFWKEGERVVVLDYKTDAVDTKEDLVGLYKEQLDLYGYALCKSYGIPLSDETKKETLIYSFKFQEVITL